MPILFRILLKSVALCNTQTDIPEMNAIWPLSGSLTCLPNKTVFFRLVTCHLEKVSSITVFLASVTVLDVSFSTWVSCD